MKEDPERKKIVSSLMMNLIAFVVFRVTIALMIAKNVIVKSNMAPNLIFNYEGKYG